MTFKLYKDAGDTTPRIFLTNEGKPALTTFVFESGKVQGALGRQFVGAVDSPDYNDALLADPTGLTPLGKQYCAAFGVATDYDNFVRFVSSPSSQRAAFRPEFAPA